MKDKLPHIGLWILPQPKNAFEDSNFLPIPNLKKSNCIPFGYKVSKEDNAVLEPIANELKALEKAKQYVKQYSSRKVAAWLTKTTGRSISHTGLLKRIKDEGRNKRKAQLFKQWATRLEKAIKLAEKFEKTKGYKETISTEKTKTEAEYRGAA